VKNKIQFLTIIAVAVIGVIFTACQKPEQEPELEQKLPALTGTVSISGIAEVGQTLTANTANLGGSGMITFQWKRGTFYIGTNSNTYIVQSTDVGSTITVTVTRSGYIGSVISPAIGPINIFIIPITFSSVTANGNETQTTTALTLTFSQTITGLTASDITLSGVLGVQKGVLSGSGATYTLPISGFTSGGTLNVVVAKSGYAISGSPKTVDIYYTNAVGIVINLAEINEWQLIEQVVQTTSNDYKYFTVNETYATYQWYLDGEFVGTSSYYYFNKPAGVYQLAVVVTNSSGESRSGRCRITVTQVDESEANPFPLTINTWINGNITSTASAVWYSFPVTYGTTYRIWWNDYYDGNSTKTSDVMVSATYSSGTSIFNDWDSGWYTPQSFTANQSGTVKVKIKVVPSYYSGNIGTFAVAYSTSSTRP